MSDNRKTFPQYLKSQTMYNNFEPTINIRRTPDLERSNSNKIPKRYVNNFIKSSQQRQQFSRLRNNKSQQGNFYYPENAANIASEYTLF
jgi:hypothetical protein